METYVKMTIDEFNELKETQNRPSKLVEETISNLTAKLFVATEKIKELEKENSMYAIGGMKKRVEPKAVATTSWIGNDEMRLKTYVQETARLKKLGEDFSMWHVNNLAEEIGRSESAVKTKARTMGYKIYKGYIVK